MIKSRKSWLTLASAGLVAGIAALAAGCETGPSTYYYDYLTASGTVYQLDGRTPVADLRIDNYDWIVSYTDGSTVAVPFAPAVSTDANGQFKFDSSSLALQSGNLAESCTDVCVATETRYEDYCSEWTTEGGGEYCTGWSTDSNGNEYCTGWAYEESTEYCSAWSTSSYEACVAWGQDCSYYYPARDIGDISQAYAEITTTYGFSTLVTSSSTTNYPSTSVQQTSTINDMSKNTTVDTIWNETDSFTTPLVIGVQARKQTLTENQAKITAARNAALIKARKITKPLPAGVTAPRARLTRKDAVKLPIDKLSIEQMLKVEAARNGCGATLKSAK